MFQIIISGIVLILLIRIVLKHNSDFSLRLKIKVIGLEFEINSKEKGTPSSK